MFDNQEKLFEEVKTKKVKYRNEFKSSDDEKLEKMKNDLNFLKIKKLKISDSLEI